MGIHEFDVAVIGAGPAGLTAALELTKLGLRPVVLEADREYVGGIARTVEREGYRFDIGGHRFFSKNQEVEGIWSEVLGGDLLERGRLSRIHYRGRYFDYPLRAANALINLGPLETVRCIASYVRARLNPVREPKTLEEWVTNQFGKRLFEIFFKTYTEKVWGISTSELSADWAAQRIKALNMAEVLRSALLPGRKDGPVITTLIDSFRYPRRGPGQMWERTAELVRRRGGEVRLGWPVTGIECDPRGAVSVSGPEGRVATRHFVSTAPIKDLVQMLKPLPPDRILDTAGHLGYRDFLTVALVIEAEDVFPDNWIYVHDPGVLVGRLQNFKNWSPEMVPDPKTTCIGLEYFCFEGDGLWERADENLVELATRELGMLGLARPDQVRKGWVVRMPKAYPVYDDVYAERVATIRTWLERAVPNLHLCGRNGMHKYNNQDHSMVTALLVARRIAGVSTLDPWKVNADAEYHEEVRVDMPDRSGRRVPARV